MSNATLTIHEVPATAAAPTPHASDAFTDAQLAELRGTISELGKLSPRSLVYRLDSAVSAAMIYGTYSAMDGLPCRANFDLMLRETAKAQLLVQLLSLTV